MDKKEHAPTKKQRAGAPVLFLMHEKSAGKTNGQRTDAPANPLGAAFGARQSVSVGAKIGSSSVVNTHKTRDKVGFGLVFRRGRDGKPMMCGHAARLVGRAHHKSRVEGEVRAEDFWREDFLEGNANAGIHKYYSGVLVTPAHTRTSSPSLAVLRNIINGGDGSPKFIWSILQPIPRLPLLIFRYL